MLHSSMTNTPWMKIVAIQMVWHIISLKRSKVVMAGTIAGTLLTMPGTTSTHSDGTKRRSGKCSGSSIRVATKGAAFLGCMYTVCLDRLHGIQKDLRGSFQQD